MRNEEHLAVARAFEDAALDSDAWQVAIRGLASATGSRRAELLGIGAAALAFSISDVPADGYREFNEAVGYSPLANPRVAAGLNAAPMEVVRDKEYEAAASGRQIDAFKHWIRALDIPYGCQTTLIRKPTHLIGLSVLRTHKEGPINPTGASAFAALAPHALAAVRTRVALGERSIRDVAAGLEHADIAAFLCDADGSVRAATMQAEALAGAGGLLGLRAGRLVAADPVQNSNLQALLARGLAGKSPMSETVFRGLDGRSVVVHARPLPRVDWASIFEPRLLVVVRQQPKRPAPEVLREAFGFTAAEAEIALALTEGVPRELIATRRDVSLGTLRQQVKSIFAKAGVGRETELVLAVLALG